MPANDDYTENRVGIARLEQICENIDKNVCDGFAQVNKRIDQIDGKQEMSRKDIDGLGKKVSKIEHDYVSKDEFRPVKAGYVLLYAIGSTALGFLVLYVMYILITAALELNVTP